MGKFSITLFVATFLLSLASQAMVFPNGAFVPNQCGVQTIEAANQSSPAIVSACIGSISGSPERAIEFKLSDDSVHVFKVVSRQNMLVALMSGATMSIFHLVDENGQDLAMKAIINSDGSVKSLSGEFQANSYLVPTLQQMMTIM